MGDTRDDTREVIFKREIDHMDKRFRVGVFLVVALFCLISAMACAADNSGDASLVERVDAAGVQASPEGMADDAEGSVSLGSDLGAGEPAPLDMGLDMGISAGGQWFPIWQDASGLLSTLGGDYILSTAPSCVFEGEDKEFAFDGFYVFTNPDGDRDIWYSFYIETDAFPTARGIKVGDSLDDVFSAYGDRYYWEGDTILTYSISGVEGDAASPCIQFTVLDGFVAAIDIYYPTNVM